MSLSLVASITAPGRAFALALAALGAGACNGAAPVLEDSESAAATTTGEPTTTDATSPTEASPSEAGATSDPAALPDPFEQNRTNVKLLPFRVRFDRLRQLSGLTADDPAFAVLRARRYELGDYDYANGVNPDLTWNASRISVWVSAVLPVCRSSAMRTRFPTFPSDLPKLLTAAYGLKPTADQLSDYETLLGDASLDEDARHDSICVAVLTGLEFVAK